MARLRFWQAPGLAFHSERPYLAAARRWRGLGLGYLLFLATVVWLPAAVDLQRDFAWIRDTFVPAVIDDLPDIVIRNGEAQVMAETPVSLTGPVGSVVAVLDPEATAGDVATTKGELLLTRDHLYLETIQGVRSLDLATIGEAVVTRDAVQDAADVTTRWIGWLAYPVGAGLSFLYRLVQVLIYAFATVVLARTLGTTLKYAAAVRVTAVALTPAMILVLAQTVTGLSIPAWWVVALATTFIYIYFGVRGLSDAALEAADEAARDDA